MSKQTSAQRETRDLGYEENRVWRPEMSTKQSHNQDGGFVGRPMTPSERSFEAGYRYGLRDDARELSNREVDERFPDVADQAAFVQGMLDGLAGDDWRHRCMVEHIREHNNMDSVLVAEMVERHGHMEPTIGHGPEASQ